MKINQGKMNEFIKTLKAHKCPLCGNGEWTVSDKVFYVQELTQSLEKGEVIIGGPTIYMPLIAISCTKCGNTHMINTLVAKLYDHIENDNENQEDNN